LEPHKYGDLKNLQNDVNCIEAFEYELDFADFCPLVSDAGPKD
jgi:hypothetical protein